LTLRKHVILGITLLVVACTDNGESLLQVPHGSDEPDFYPLAIGNRWEYHLVYDGTLRDELGNDVRPPVHLEACSIRSLVTSEDHFGREYIVEQEMVYSDEGTDTVYAWDRFRQEADGLYRLNIPPDLPPNTRYADEDPGDDRILAYPIEVGEWWYSLSDSTATTTVESTGSVSTAAGKTTGYRLRIDQAAAGPSDSLNVWYGGCGLLRQTLHIEFNAMGPEGETLHFVRRESETLTDVQLVDANGCVVEPSSAQ